MNPAHPLPAHAATPAAAGARRHLWQVLSSLKKLRDAPADGGTGAAAVITPDRLAPHLANGPRQCDTSDFEAAARARRPAEAAALSREQRLADDASQGGQGQACGRSTPPFDRVASQGAKAQPEAVRLAPQSGPP